MTTMRAMPRYTSHKTVWALKIGATSGGPGMPLTIHPAEPGYDAFEVTREWAARHQPESGGYYVVYEDGYASFSPAEAFVKGYTPVDGPRVIDPGHRYRIGGAQVLQFLKKEQRDGEFVITASGTTNEELIDVLLDRIRALNATVPCRENSLAITKLEEARHWLDARTRNRMQQGVEGTAAAHV